MTYISIKKYLFGVFNGFLQNYWSDVFDFVHEIFFINEMYG